MIVVTMVLIVVKITMAQTLLVGQHEVTDESLI